MAMTIATAATLANAAPAQPMVVNARPVPMVQTQKVVQRPNQRPAVAPRPNIVYVNQYHHNYNNHYAYNTGYGYYNNYNNGAANVAALVTLGLVTGGVIYALAK